MNRQGRLRRRSSRSWLQSLAQLCWMWGVVALLVATELYTTGCGLILDFAPKEEAVRGYRYRCEMTVRNSEVGPDGRLFEKHITSDDLEFRDRPFFTCISDDAALCPPGCARTEEDVIRNWRNWVARRIEDFITGRATLGEFTSDFELYREPWCEVEGTARCELLEPLPPTPEPLCPSLVDPLPDETLESCPASPIPCLELDPLDIDFGSVPVGRASGPVPVTVRNCDTSQVRIRVAKDTVRGNPDDFVITANGCAPRDTRERTEDRPLDPMEECTLDVQFNPMRPRTRIGFIRIESEGHFTRGTFGVVLRGEGVPGELGVDPNPACFRRASRVGGCWVHDVIITNSGPGDVRVNVPMITPPYEIESVDPAGAFPRTLNPVGTPPPSSTGLRVRLRLCSDTREDGELLINSDAAESPVSVRLVSPSHPCP